MAVAPLLMIGGSALAGYIGSKLGKNKNKNTGVNPPTPGETPQLAAPPPPTPVPQATSEATVKAKTAGTQQRRKAAAGQGFRTNPRRGAAQGTITPAVTPMMLIGGSA